MKSIKAYLYDISGGLKYNQNGTLLMYFHKNNEHKLEGWKIEIKFIERINEGRESK